MEKLKKYWWLWLLIVLLVGWAVWYFYFKPKQTTTTPETTPQGGSGSGTETPKKPPIPNIEVLQPTGGISSGNAPVQSSNLAFTPKATMLTGSVNTVQSTDANGNVVTNCEVVYGSRGAGLTWCGQELTDLQAEASCSRNIFNKLTCN